MTLTQITDLLSGLRARRSDGTLGSVEADELYDALKAAQALILKGRHDKLTGLLRRDEGLEAVELLVRQLRDVQVSQTWGVFLDMDNLKALNNRDPALADQALASLGVCIRAVVRPSDVALRIGGDEMGVFLDPRNRRLKEGLQQLHAEAIAVRICGMLRMRSAGTLSATWAVRPYVFADHGVGPAGALETIQAAWREAIAKKVAARQVIPTFNAGAELRWERDNRVLFVGGVPYGTLHQESSAGDWVFHRFSDGVKTNVATAGMPSRAVEAVEKIVRKL